MPKILAIEDNEAVREELADILRFEGYEVVEAENGRHGLEMLREAKPDLILCDLMMPEMDGYEMLRHVRADARLATMPFVCLTARAERADMRRAMETGADDYVIKPFTAEELVAAVRAGLEKRVRVEQESDEKLTDLRQRIASSLPHELRTPLGSIVGFAELLMDPATAARADEVVDAARRIQGAARRLRRLVENFLLFAELELLATSMNRRVTRMRQSSPVGSIVAQISRNVAEEANRLGDLAVDVHAASICVGPTYLRKLVEELVDNACKFSKPGTPIRVASSTRGDDWVLCVSDRGRGMTRQQIASVEAYVQFDRLVHEQQGVGLGLGIARRLVNLCDGVLTIDSEPGQGTTVKVQVPLAETSVDATPADRMPPWRRNGGNGCAA